MIMKYLNNLLIIIFIIIFFLASCGKQKELTPAPEQEGKEVNVLPLKGGKGIYMAINRIWPTWAPFTILNAQIVKDSQIYSLTKGVNSSAVNDIFVLDDNVYSAGYEIENGISVAKYWINSQEVKLTDGRNNAEAQSIIAVSNNIYIVGTEMRGSHKAAIYWKNGLPFNLEDGTSGSKDVHVRKIFIADDDIYILGFEGDPTPGSLTETHPLKPIIWKNGKAIKWYQDECYCYASSIYVSQNDIYVGGEHIDKKGILRAGFWKNNHFTFLDTDENNSIYYSSINSIFVKGSDLHMTGYKFYNDGSKKWESMAYWKNSATSILEIPDALGYSIYISDQDVYIGGIAFNRNTSGEFDRNIATVKYWKNGVGKEIMRGTLTTGFSVSSIFIVP